MMGTGMRPIFAQAYTGDGGRLTLFRMRGKINPARLESLAKGLQVISWERNGESVALVGDIDGAKIRAVARELGGPG
jgi:hypothetical protein